MNAHRVRSGHIQRNLIFIFRICRGLRAAPNAFSR
nr:MAG TPA: Pre-mRNA-splicing factor 8, Pre-mRNA-splicing factor, B* complex, branching, snRNP [Caudoviricetes sp.]